MPSSPIKKLSAVLALLALSLTAGCQAVSDNALIEDVVSADKSETTVGAGPHKVSLLLSRDAAQSQMTQDIRDGGSLAMSDLGQDMLSLTFRYADGPSQLVLDDGASLSFVSNSAERRAGQLAFRSDAVDSSVEGLKVIAGSGKNSVVVIAPSDFAAGDMARLNTALKLYKVKLLGEIRYSAAPAELAGQLQAQKTLLAKADVVLILGAGALPGQVATALRSQSLVEPSTLFVGNMDWSRQNFATPALQASLIAYPNQDRLQIIAARFKKRFGRDLTVDAAYGYDAVAVVAGLARAAGGEALTQDALKKASGFRGTLGLFRFQADGAVQRPLTLYTLINGKLELADPEPDGF